MSDQYRGGVGRETVGRRATSPVQGPSLGPVQAACDSVITAAAEALAGTEGRLVEARSAEGTEIKQAEREAAKARTASDNQLQARLSQARQRVNQAVTVLANGVQSASWTSPDWGSICPAVLDVAHTLRLGQLALVPGRGSPTSETLKFPLLVPLLNTANLVLRTKTGADVTAVIQAAVLRALASTGPGQLEIHLHDPAVRSTLAPFAGLRAANPDLFPSSGATDQNLCELLDGLTQDVRRISDLYRGRPFDLAGFRADTDQPIETFQLIVLLDYPRGVSKESNDLLATLVRTGPTCGISFLIHFDPSAAPEREVDPTIVIGKQPLLDLKVTPPRHSAFPEFEVSLDPPPPLALTEQALEQIVAGAKQAAAPVIPFIQLPDSQIWTESSRDRIEATFAVAGHEPVVLRLGDEQEQRHNVLVSGAVGQGKSNLLMAIVHDLAQRYSPAELEMFLLDFKDGVTLYPLSDRGDGQGWLPHAKVLGLESDRQYGAAVLAYLVAEFERRSQVMKPFGDNLTRYRLAQPNEPMARMLVVIDEFQVLFETDDDLCHEALADLERLAKKGRAYGMHLILASQTLSGITTMLAKQDGIFSQFPIRLALKNSAAESRVVLDQQNTEAAKLRYRGEAIINVDFGAPGANSRAVVMSATPDEMARLRGRLWSRGHHESPAVFDGTKPALLTDELASLQQLRDRARTKVSSRLALVGKPIAVRTEPIGVPFSPDTGRHLALIGAGATQSTQAGGPISNEQNVAVGALQAAALSLALQHPEGDAIFSVLDLLPQEDSTGAQMADFVTTLGQLGAAVDVVHADGVGSAFGALGSELQARTSSADERALTRYVLGFGLDRARGLSDINLMGGGVAPIDHIRELLRSGPPLGMHLLGWWGNARTFRDHLGFEASGLIDGLVLFRVPASDVTDLLGPFVTWTPQPNRALLRDASQSDEPEPLVPFAPLDRRELRLLSLREWDG